MIVEAQKFDNNTDNSDNSSHEENNNNTIKQKQKNTQNRKPNINVQQSPFIIDNDDDNNVYVDANYKQYKITVRRSNEGIKLKTFGSAT